MTCDSLILRIHHIQTTFICDGMLALYEGWIPTGWQLISISMLVILMTITLRWEDCPPQQSSLYFLDALLGAPVVAIGFKNEGGHIPQTLVPEDMGCNIKGLTKKRPLFQPFKHEHHNADNLTLVSNGDLLSWRLTMLPAITDRLTYRPNVDHGTCDFSFDHTT